MQVFFYFLQKNDQNRVRDWKGYGIVQQCRTQDTEDRCRQSRCRITSDLKDKIAGWHPAEWKKIFGTKRALVHRVLLSGFGRSRLSCELRRNGVSACSESDDIQTVSFGHIKGLIVLRPMAEMRQRNALNHASADVKERQFGIRSNAMCSARDQSLETESSPDEVDSSTSTCYQLVVTSHSRQSHRAH